MNIRFLVLLPLFSLCAHAGDRALSHSAFLEPTPVVKNVPLPQLPTVTGTSYQPRYVNNNSWRCNTGPSYNYNWHTHGSNCYYNQGFWKTCHERVWVEGLWIREYSPAQYQTYQGTDGLWYTTLVRAAGWWPRYVEGSYETYTYTIWINGGWSCGY